MAGPQFIRYMAFGDSISIDKYPERDHLERTGGRPPEGMGAAALFFRNNDALWPEFSGRDLTTLVPGIQFDRSDDYTEDGWTTEDVIRDLRHLASSDERIIVTLTIGGNDLVMAIGGRSFSGGRSDTPVPEIAARLDRIVDTLLQRLPNSVLLVGTVYDPSDGTNTLGPYSGGRRLDREAVWLRDYNHFVRDLPGRKPRVLVADIHRHFLGHGLSVPPGERWYWGGLIIEPNARGASEVRRVWLETLSRER